MEHLLALLAAWRIWRTVLATVVAVAAAFLLARHVSWFTGGHGLAVVILAFGAGLLWDASARSPGAQRTVAPIKLSTPVATLALAFFGAVVGAWASDAAGSLIGGAIALVAGAAAVFAYTSRVEKRPFAWGAFAHSALSLLVGLGCIALLVAGRA